MSLAITWWAFSWVSLGKGSCLTPFSANYNIYLGDLTTALGTPGRRIASGLAGAIFDLLVSVIIRLGLWQKRSPKLLPLLAMGSLALIHESVNMTMGVLKGYGDWSELSEVGVPSVIVILLAVFLLAAGCIWMLQLLPLTGISPRDPFWGKLAVYLAGMPLLMLCSVVFLTLFWADVYVPSHYAVTLRDVLRMDKVIFMAASTVLSVIVTLLHRPLLPWLDRISHTPVAHVRSWEVLIAIGLEPGHCHCSTGLFQGSRRGDDCSHRIRSSMTSCGERKPRRFLGR